MTIASGAGGRSPRTVALGPGGEFDLIRRLLADADDVPGEVMVGPGDDAAVLEGGWVLSTDLSVEDVHFRRAWISDAEIGWRACASALSDLAAMAARPVGVLISLAVPAGGAGAADVERVHFGIREAASAVGAAVLGGDVSRSPGPLVVDVVVVGRAEHPALRCGARPGDELWVSGGLGAAAAAVRLWADGREPGPELRRSFARPLPRIREARSLAGALAENDALHALVDLSDGLAGDAGHVAAAGGVRIVLEALRIPIAPAARDALGEGRALEAALHGGEDYELCFAAPPGAVTASLWSGESDVPLTRVGRIEEGSGVWLDAGDGAPPHRLERGGFSHVDPASEVGPDGRTMSPP